MMHPADLIGSKAAVNKIVRGQTFTRGQDILTANKLSDVALSGPLLESATATCAGEDSREWSIWLHGMCMESNKGRFCIL